MYNYLPHPSNMRTSDHVLSMRIREGAAGYGIYMMLLELLRDAEGRALVKNPAHLAFAINEPDAELVRRVLEDYALFDVLPDGRICSPWLNEQMAEYDAKKAAAVEAGKRGAAKRYGHKAEQNKEDGHPIATLKGGGKPAYGNITNPNITLQNNTNQPNSKSRLLEMAWDKWSGEELFLIARQRGNVLSPLERDEVEGRLGQLVVDGRDDLNPVFPLDVAEAMRFSHEQYEVLCSVLQGGRTGTPRMAEAVRIYEEWRANKFRARYPFEHLIVRLLDIPV